MLLCQAYLDHHRFGTYGRPHLQCAEPCHSPSTTLIPSLITFTALTQSSHVFFFDNLGFPPTLPSHLTGYFMSETAHTCTEQLAAFTRQAQGVFGDTSFTWLCPQLSQTVTSTVLGTPRQLILVKISQVIYLSNLNIYSKFNIFLFSS